MVAFTCTQPFLYNSSIALSVDTMFITVRFADDKTELFNPDCRNCLLLNNIKERCDCDDDDFIDLSDESGSLKHLQRFPLDYGTKHLNEREILILVKGERTDGDKMTFVPLLDGMESNSAFLQRLNPPPPKPEKVRSASRDSPAPKLYNEGARGKRASLAPKPKQLGPPPSSSSRSLSPSRRGSRMRSQSVQLSQAPVGGSFNATRRAR